MRAGAKLLGHPIHPMLIVFPLGLLATAVAFDIVGLVQSNYSWFGVSYWMIAAGIIGGLLAAVFGLIDWIAIPSGTRAKSIGLLHGGTNVLAVLLFVVSWFIRNGSDAHVPTTARVGVLVCSRCAGLSWRLAWWRTRRPAWHWRGSGRPSECAELALRQTCR